MCHKLCALPMLSCRRESAPTGRPAPVQRRTASVWTPARVRGPDRPALWDRAADRGWHRPYRNQRALAAPPPARGSPDCVWVVGRTRVGWMEDGAPNGDATAPAGQPAESDAEGRPLIEFRLTSQSFGALIG